MNCQDARRSCASCFALLEHTCACILVRGLGALSAARQAAVQWPIPACTSIQMRNATSRSNPGLHRSLLCSDQPATAGQMLAMRWETDSCLRCIRL